MAHYLRSVEVEKQLKAADILAPTRPGQSRSIVNAERDRHQRMRRTVAHAFSEKAFREQEAFSQSYVDQLICRLRQVHRQAPQDLVRWQVAFGTGCSLG